MKNQFLLCVLIGLIIGSCKSKSESNEIPKNSISNRVTLDVNQQKQTKIQLSEIKEQMIAKKLKLSGKIDVPPQNTISVCMPLGGYLKSSNLLPGMPVSKGQKIAEMEDVQYVNIQQEYLTGKAQLKFLEADYLRQKELNESKAISDKEFQQSQMKFMSMKIALRSLEQKLKMININPNSLTIEKISKCIAIFSPISGFVSKVNVNIGQYVNPADAMFELVNPSDIHLNLTVYEKDINALKIGQKIIAYSNNLPEKKYKADIILIGHALSEQRFVEVHCHFDKYDKELAPGMYMNAEVSVENATAKVVPEEAIVHFEGKDYIFVATSNNSFELSEVETGGSENGMIEITNSTPFEHKKIVIKGAYDLLMALKNKEEAE